MLLVATRLLVVSRRVTRLLTTSGRVPTNEEIAADMFSASVQGAAAGTKLRRTRVYSPMLSLISSSPSVARRIAINSCCANKMRDLLSLVLFTLFLILQIPVQTCNESGEMETPPRDTALTCLEKAVNNDEGPRPMSGRRHVSRVRYDETLSSAAIATRIHSEMPLWTRARGLRPLLSGE